MDYTSIKMAVFAAFAAIGTALANLMGGWDMTIQVLLGLMLIDIITGVLLATVFKASNKTITGALSSNAMLRGGCKKAVMLLIVLMCSLMDKALGLDYLCTAAKLFFIANEGLSILENTALMGVPYPRFIKTVLDALKEKSDNAEAPTDNI